VTAVPPDHVYSFSVFPSAYFSYFEGSVVKVSGILAPTSNLEESNVTNRIRYREYIIEYLPASMQSTIGKL
jgi:hypothetical protein